MTSLLVTKSIGGLDMNKEEILSIAQNEGKGKDIADSEAIKNASRIAYAVISVATGIAAIYFEFRYNIKVMYYWLGALWLSQSALFITKYVLLRKKHELALSIFYFVIFIGVLVMGIINGQ